MSTITRTQCDDPRCWTCSYDNPPATGPAEHGDPASCRQLISHAVLSYGDYDNSCAVERANVHYLEENDLIAHRETGSYGGVTAWLLATPENQELLESLDNYPCFDDELVSLVEAEIEDEYITNAGNDLHRECTREYQTAVEDCDLGTDINREAYEQAKEETNTYFQVESGGNGYIDFKRLAPVYEAIMLKNNLALALLIQERTARNQAQWPVAFYESAADMLQHIDATGQSLTDHATNRAILQYAADMEDV